MQILPATRSRMNKVDESGNIFDTLDSYPVHFARLPNLYIARGFALSALADEMFV